MGRSTFNNTVRGTLADPPVIVEQDRQLSFELALAAPLLTGIAIYKAAAAGASTSALALILLGGLLFTGLLVFKFFRNDTLQANADGLLVRTGVLRTRFQWYDFSHFERDFGETNAVVGVFGEKNHQGRLPGETQVMALFATEAQSLDFLNLLQAAQAKWGNKARLSGSHVEDAMPD